MTVAVDANTVAYLPLTTDLTDQCGNTWEANGGAAVSGGALVLDGTDDFITTPISPLNVGDTWTYEGYVNFSSLPSMTYVPSIVSAYKDNDNRLNILAQFNGNSGLYAAIAIAGTIYQIKNNFIPTVGTWYHVAFVRNGNALYFFIGGNLIGSASLTVETPTFTYTLAVGSGYWSSVIDGLTSFPGKIKHFRISKTARYTVLFTPPTFGDDSLARRRQVV